MHRLMMAAAMVAALVAAPLPAHAVERAAIAEQRRVLIERFAAQEQDCAGRFQATACIEDLRARRRHALAPLRERELQLDEVERGRRAAERRTAIAAKREAAAARAPDPVVPEWRPRAPLPPARAASRPAVSRAASQARAAEARQTMGDAQERQQQAEEVQQRIRRRLDERAAQGRKPDPLPLPAASVPAAR